MTVTTTESRVSYTGNGVATDYVITYPYLAQTDIVCSVDNVAQQLGTDYTISGDNTIPGSTLSFVAAPADGAAILIVRRTSPVQLTEYAPFGPYKAEQHEADFDKAMLLNQESQNNLLALGGAGPITASAVSYDNTSSGLAAGDVQEAIDEIAATSINRTEWGEYSAKAFGAAGDGATDDRAAIQAAIDAASAAGGGIVIIEEGVYIVSGALIYASNVVIRGLGRGATVVRLQNAANDHVFNTAATITDAVIESMTIDGNRAGQTAGGHCIRSGDDMERVVFRDLHILNAYTYGIGLQGADPNTGLLEDVLIANCHVESSGHDGIDIKNRADANVGVKMDNLYIKGVDQRGDGGKSGIDVRGYSTLSNIFVDLEATPAAIGIEFVAGGAGNESGLGGRESSLTNFWIIGQSTAVIQQVGVQITQRNVGVSNGYISNVYRGVRFGGLSESGADSCVLTNVRIRDAIDNAIRLENGNDQNVIANCWIANAGDVAISIGQCNNTILLGTFISDNQGVGQVEIASGAAGTIIDGSNQLTGAGTEVNDSGSNTKWTKFGLHGDTAPAASVPGNFSADRYLEVRNGEGTTYYVPVRTSTW